MSVIVRLATEIDASGWLELVVGCVGREYPARQVYDRAWVKRQLTPRTGQETWIAEVDGRVQASISFLTPTDAGNPVGNLGRFLHRPESYANGSAQALLHRVTQLSVERHQMLVTRVPVNDKTQQILLEGLDYVCVGYQPFKHTLPTRQGILFYVHPASQVLVTRLPLSESLPQISTMAAVVLDKLKISNLLTIRDGATGYPLHTELKFSDGTLEEFESWRSQLETAKPVVEVSTGYNRGFGLMRVLTDAPVRAVLGRRDSQTLAGLAYIYDEHDRCVRICDAFASDGLSTGSLFQQIVKQAQEQLNVAYVEVDILMTAPRLMKCAEQLGFVPVAYLPAFYSQDGHFTDIVKMVKLNLAYAPDPIDLTPHAGIIVNIINQYFEDPKMGGVTLNMLRQLKTFDGLGEGDLRKIARLFARKLYHSGEQIFQKGDPGEAMFIVLRGQVDMRDEHSKIISSVHAGEIFGELSVLSNASRAATAVASQSSILLVAQRQAFNDLIQQEPLLGLPIYRNLALDLTNKLRVSNPAAAAMKL
ncbi:MAG TPA: cyclic nucleotide-binding domain-containing protein [Candidatus Eisenbacteria bacterium]|jgi:hypothetical protein|nr:cyclic nucleotide-binding domain-containing protein [Candidatus Eisenbacteria bacterium]